MQTSLVSFASFAKYTFSNSPQRSATIAAATPAIASRNANAIVTSLLFCFFSAEEFIVSSLCNNIFSGCQFSNKAYASHIETADRGKTSLLLQCVRAMRSKTSRISAILFLLLLSISLIVLGGS